MRQAAPRKICHVLGRLERAGAELRTLELMRQLACPGVQFHVCTISGLPGMPDGRGGGSLEADVRNLGGIIHPCPMGATFPWQFQRLLRRQRFDVVHAHLFYFSGYLLRLAGREGVPVRVAHLRDTQDHHVDGPLRVLRRRLLRHWIQHHATHILAVSEAAMAAAWRPDWRSDTRCRVIYDGVESGAFAQPADHEGVRREFGFQADCPLYLHVGRMAPAKNHARVLAIFGHVVKQQPAARLLLVGRGGNEVEVRLREQVARRGFEGLVVMAGERGDVARLLLAADLLLFPSLAEGLPGVVLEACAAGLPVLASDLASVQEIAAHFPWVVSLSLTASDQAWARRAEELRADANLAAQRHRAPEAFPASVFGIRRCATSMCEVWGVSPTGT
ncbi:MAG: glycosyltransferase [Candidatus Tectomicrobia bacterium]|nr:glycosyltransferase [Candidatus Tectomicrobia bacterium]